MYINKKEQEAIFLAVDIMQSVVNKGNMEEEVDEGIDVLIGLQNKIIKNNLREQKKKRIKSIDWSD